MKPKSHLHRSIAAPALIVLCAIGGQAQAGEHTYRYFRFVPTASETGQTQMSEFNFINNGKKLNLMAAGTTAESTGAGPVHTVTVSGGTNAVTAGEGANMLLDGSVTTKMFSNALSTLTFDFGEPVTIDAYNFATANDFLTRTPTAWTFQGSMDGVNYFILDTRTGQTPLHNTTFTYQTPLALPDIAGAPVINSVSATTPAIITAGGTVNLTHAISGSPTSVILNPGAIDITATPDFSVSPSGSTSYTITATNASGSVNRTFHVGVVAPNTATCRYVRFMPLLLRGGNANSIQVADFDFYSGGTRLTVNSVTNPNGNNSGDGAPANVIDGLANTKWLDFNKQGLVFDFGSSQSFDSYELTTGNDATERDPVCWILEGSDNLADWSTIAHVHADNYPMPAGRNVVTGRIPLNYSPLVWTGDQTSDWNTVDMNFSGASSVFANGGAVLFNEVSYWRDVYVSDQLSPESIAFDNSGDSYNIQGSPTVGSASVIKNGSGSATLGNLNALTGALIVNQGLLTGSNLKSFGENNATGKFLVRDGGRVGFSSANQFNQRYWSIVNGGVFVDSGSKLTHIGPIQVFGSFTKTGAGTLTMSGIGGSQFNAAHNLIINGGIVEFTSGYFNSFAFLGNRLAATVNTGATLRGTTGSALGGDYIDAAPGIGQLRVNGGTYEHTGGIQYLSNGFVTTGGVPQGRIVLNGGMMAGAGQIETARTRNATADADASNDRRTIISTEANAVSSTISGSGALVLNPGHVVFEVVDGAADDDLVISRVINGNYGIIKEGGGNLTLTAANGYQGIAITDAPGNTTPLAFDLPHGTTVRGGTLTLANLAGSATGASPVLVQSGTRLAGAGFSASTLTVLGTIAPGHPGASAPIGALTVGPATLAGSYECEVDGPSADMLVVNGDLNISGSLRILPAGSGVTGDSYVIATYTGGRTGTFATDGLPPDYSVVYDDVAVPHEVRLVSGSAATGYDAFIANTTLTGDDALPTADPDFDGLSNLIEFVIGGNPQVSSRDNVPTMTVNGAGDFVFVFRRTAESSYLDPHFEYGTTLGGTWTPAPAPNVSVEPDGFEDGVDKITVTLPSSFSANGKLFGRLTVTR